MCIEYHYSWSCGHTETIGRSSCNEDLRVILGLQSNTGTPHETSALSLGQPGYPCLRCTNHDTPDATLRRIEELSSRVESLRQESQQARARADQARAERVRRQHGPTTYEASVRTTFSTGDESFETAVADLAVRSERADWARLWEEQERIIERIEGRLAPQLASSAPALNPTATEFVPGRRQWMSNDNPPLVNDIHHEQQHQQEDQLRRPSSLNDMAYLWNDVRRGRSSSTS